ncbi:hypothetical protein [Azohydromonas aeria]|uniref:hypothetical protein n=1 Tax=Azohydromonas aeria TaxID=2590212 RepID=UPI0012FA184A|nr:hypothetical protein [Azohydromonas aeria]
MQTLIPGRFHLTADVPNPAHDRRARNDWTRNAATFPAGMVFIVAEHANCPGLMCIWPEGLPRADGWGSLAVDPDGSMTSSGAYRGWRCVPALMAHFEPAPAATPEPAEPCGQVETLRAELQRAHRTLRKGGYDMTGIDAAIASARNV